MNPLLYGHNPKPGVVAVHQLNDRTIRLYIRTDGKVQHEDAEFFPFFFLSGALTPLENFPWFIRALSYADPLTYGVDGLRGVLIGTSSLPVLVDLAAMAGFALIMLFLGAYSFETSEGV